MKKKKTTRKNTPKRKTVKKKTLKKSKKEKKVVKNPSKSIKKREVSNTVKEFSSFHKLILVLGSAILAFIFSVLVYLYISQIIFLNLIFVFIFSLFISRILAKQTKKTTLCCSCSGCLIGIISSILFIFTLLIIFLYVILIQDIFIYFISALVIGGVSCALGSRSII